MELNALLEIYRLQLMLNCRNSDGDFCVHEGYLYSVIERIHPYFHKEWCGEQNPFESCYEITATFVEEVFNYIDEKSVNKKPIPTFDQLEKKYGTDAKWKLIRVLRYCYLSQMFDDEIYKSILTDTMHPPESRRIIEKLNEYDLGLV